jgi:DNA-binding response OmpR family regulator
MTSIPDDMTILIVEDDPGHARLLEILLRNLGVTNDVIKVDRGDAAMRHLDLGAGGSGPADARTLVLLDINLPGASGFDVLKALRTLESSHRTPVVIVSSSDDPSDHRRAAELGADGYLVKPPSNSELEDMISRLCLPIPGETP